MDKDILKLFPLQNPIFGVKMSSVYVPVMVLFPVITNVPDLLYVSSIPVNNGGQPFNDGIIADVPESIGN
jgi:hypothetical protein